MFNILFKPSISRSEHDRILKMFQDALAKTIEERDAAYDDRDVAHDEYAAAVKRELHAIEERDAYNAIATRALILLNKVNPTRTGGKQLRDAREVLFADAMLAGLWGELPIKE